MSQEYFKGFSFFYRFLKTSGSFLAFQTSVLILILSAPCPIPLASFSTQTMGNSFRRLKWKSCALKCDTSKITFPFRFGIVTVC